MAQRFRELIAEAKATGASQQEAERRALSHAQALARLAQAAGQTEQAQRVLVAALTAVNRETVAATQAETAYLAVQGRAAREAQQLADSEIRAARATGDHQGALQRIQAQLAQTAAGTARYNQLLAQKAAADRAAAPPQAALTQYVTQFKSGLAGVVGPAAAATAAIAAVTQVAQSFGEALAFTAQLDVTNAGVAIQVQQFRDYGQVQAEAQQFARQYKLTQEQLAASLQAGIPVLRQSNASTFETLQTFQLLQATAPEKPISEAARAIRELATGDVTSIKELFNVPAREAHAMKVAIEQGQDPVKVVADYLKRAGADAALLAVGTQGTAGALKDAAVAAEELKIAQGELAAAGVPLIEAQSSATRGLARVLRGDLIPSFDELNAKSAIFRRGFQEGNFGGSSPFGGILQGIFAVGTQTAVVTRTSQEAVPAVAAVSGAFVAAQSAVQAAADRQAAYNAVARDTITLAAADIVQKQQQQLATDRLSAFNRDLEAAALRVATGQATQGQEAAALAARYPELGGQIGQIISRQVQLASTTEAASQKLREQQLLAQQAQTRDLTDGRGTIIGAPGRQGSTLDDFDRIQEEIRRADEARRQQQLALADTAGRVRLYREELAALRAKGAAEDVLIAKSTELQLAERQLAAEQERATAKAERSGAARVRAGQSTALQLQNVARTSAEELVRIERDAQQRIADLQEDFDVRKVRATEDFERRRRRLLAEGKRFEADQLAEEFAREQRRAQEDLDRARARQAREVDDRLGDQGVRVNRQQDTIAARAAIRGVPAGGFGAALPDRSLVPAPADAAGPLAVAPPRPMQLIIEFGVQQWIADGRVLAEVSYPRIEQLLNQDLTRVAVTQPPSAPGAAGPRP